MHNQQQPDMRVSAIPLTPVRTRERNNNGQHQYSSTPAQRSTKTVTRFEDIMNERPDPSAIDHLSLPEDHLEDILSLPIAAELRSRRSKASLASGSDRTTSTTAFPSSSTSHTRRDAAGNHPTTSQDASSSYLQAEPSLSNKRKDSLRKGSQSSPMRVVDVSESPNSASQNDLSDSSYTNNYHDTSSTPAESSKKARRADTVPLTPSRPNPVTPTSSSSSKQRGKSPTSSSSANVRKSPNLNGQGSGPRRPLQSSSTSTNRQASTPLKKPSASTPPSRTRSSSTSLLSKAIQHDWDENSKPPWLDESPTYLYKSDIENIVPGSLADIARQAQGRANNPLSSSAPGNAPGDGDSSVNMGDTSIRSWDDVILPAVARQIRAQQMMEMQKNISKGSHNGNNEDLLVTEWNADGTPRNWKYVKRKHPSSSTQQEQEHMSPTSGMHKDLPDPQQDMLQVFPTSNAGSTTQSSANLQPCLPYNQERERESRIRTQSTSSQHLGIQQSSTSENSQQTSHAPSSSQSRHTGRRELWEDPALRSPATAAENGFAQPRMRGAVTNRSAEERTHGQQLTVDGPSNEKQDTNQSGKSEEDGKHSGGCCKCIVM